MGSSSSKPLAEATRDEKTGAQGQPSPRRQEIGAHQVSTHHAADRLLRIAAEATASHNDQTSSIPEHENTHAEVKMEALKAWDAVALKDPTSQLAAMTIHNTIIRDSIRRRTAETADQHVFSHTLPSELRVQRHLPLSLPTLPSPPFLSALQVKERPSSTS